MLVGITTSGYNKNLILALKVRTHQGGIEVGGPLHESDGEHYCAVNRESDDHKPQ